MRAVQRRCLQTCVVAGLKLVVRWAFAVVTAGLVHAYVGARLRQALVNVPATCWIVRYRFVAGRTSALVAAHCVFATVRACYVVVLAFVYIY